MANAPVLDSAPTSLEFRIDEDCRRQVSQVNVVQKGGDRGADDGNRTRVFSLGS